MLKKIIHMFIRKRHPWRDIQFDELAEIYTSMSLRSLGFGIIGIFVPIYLFHNGVDLSSIFWFFMWVFLLRIPIAIMVAYTVGRIGPKHSIALSTLLFILFLGMLLSFKQLQWPLVLLAFAFTVPNGLFFTAYHTDFSKIKDSNHGGKELGWLYIFERVGGTLGPLVGGLLASIVAPELSILLAILVLIGSLVPLFLTNEPVCLHQKISFIGFPWRRHTFDYLSMGALHIDNAASKFVWPLCIAVIVFKTDSYAKVGSIVALATAVSLYSAHMFGSFIDKSKGRQLLNYGVVLNALVHLMRPFALSGASSTIVSTLNEPATLSYQMPLMKGYYDAADSEEGYRIVYLSLVEIVGSITKAGYFICLYVSTLYLDSEFVLRWNFIFVAFLSLGIGLQRFTALKKP